MRNYFNYFTEIEEYFVRKRGRNLLISPLDWCLIELWKENGIPLHVVLRGIDRSFEAAAKRSKSAPRTLFYCHPAVLEAWEEHREAKVGKSSESAGGEVNQENVLDYLNRLIDALKPCDGDDLMGVRNRLQGIAKECSAGRFIAEAELERELAEAGSRVAQVLLEKLDGQAVQQLRKEVDKEVRRYRKRLSDEMYERLRRNYLERKVRSRFQLPDFSLMEVE
ncbi:MAG TPA: hypothetical protein VMN76_09690 [Acidobacteriota bacterium]|nr:hypothetical protein [Acidobacteriota bacterium]